VAKNVALPKKPDFITIGAMKCGTSTLHDQLNRHASLYMTDPKEPNFFSDDDVYKQGTEWYYSLFDDALGNQLKGESSTHYTKLPTYQHTVERMAELCPDVKCIYLMRNPVDRLVSHYIHEWTQKEISCDIDKAISSRSELVDYGRYFFQLNPFLDVFGKSAVLPVFLERMSRKPQTQLMEIFDFLGVKEHPIWDNGLQSNVSSERLRESRWRDMLLDNSVARAMRRKLVPKSIRTAVKLLWTVKERPVLGDDTRKHVEGIFDEDLSRLGEMLGFDLRCADFAQIVLEQGHIGWI
jgi:hypothetical protein